MVRERDLAEINGLIALRNRLSAQKKKLTAAEKSMLYWLKYRLLDLEIAPDADTN